MKRRSLLSHGLAVVGSAMALPVMSMGASTAAFRGQPSALLARLDVEGIRRRWRSLSECPGVECERVARTIRIDDIGFSENLQSASIEARFATNAAEHSFKIASLMRDSLSPVSKPFAFGAASDVLCGFEILQHVQSESQPTRIKVDMLDRVHQSLNLGSYLLVVTSDWAAADLSRIVDAAAVDDPFAVLLPHSTVMMRFTVLSPKVG